MSNGNSTGVANIIADIIKGAHEVPKKVDTPQDLSVLSKEQLIALLNAKTVVQSERKPYKHTAKSMFRTYLFKTLYHAMKDDPVELAKLSLTKKMGKPDLRELSRKCLAQAAVASKEKFGSLSVEDLKRFQDEADVENAKK
jgi:hypothetical protein